ncbi:MAG: hydrogenase formation protein HypD [Planctomycetota bacterium]|nr:MAG: hydrogenase formation protein HypD [Planctomycetota bacterium]REK25168.1 MAG: hydrogenase formation protein HypD [Planctomycetota bacterium]REK38809.1 MAG: hydrogenase formation protein HypD [Planctomycetota bacterium]
MKFVDEFRDATAVQQLIAQIRRLATRRHVVMEVCGGQTHSLLRYGIDNELRDVVELIHGPGCPVCVTPVGDIDLAVRLALQEGVTVASFGDMLRVPGAYQSLNDARAAGGDVRIVYSPVDAVKLAQRNPDEHVVFFAVGFETTAPATAIAALQAERLRLENLSMLVSHVRVLPAMEALMLAPGNRVEAFLAAGHVCTVTGFRSYETFAKQYGIPVAVTGFEPIDLLEGIRDCVRQLESGRVDVTNQYSRSVRRDGNEHARMAVNQVYEVADRPWRGFGVIKNGGLRLRAQFRKFDARRRFAHVQQSEPIAGIIDAAPTVDLPTVAQPDCPAAEVLSGRLRPADCPHFGTRCSPEKPLGAPMVSSEGACAAYYLYHRTTGVEDEFKLTALGATANRNEGSPDR